MRPFSLYQPALLRITRPPMADSRTFVDATAAHRLEALFAPFRAEVLP